MIRKSPILLFCMLLMTLMCSVANATTYNVGPTRTYTTIQSVTGLLVPGDLVLVDGGATYGTSVTLSNSGTLALPITIRGVKVNGNRPLLSGGTGNFGFNVTADNYIIEGFEINGKAKAGIGQYGDGIVIRDCVIHNCNMGILGYGTGTGNTLVEYCELYQNGLGSSSHQVYMATDEYAHPTAVFRMQYCYMHDGVGGNGVKSRSGRNEIYYNWIEGSFYHGLELIGFDLADNDNVTESTVREDADVVGNVVIASNGFACARIGGDRSDAQTLGRYRFVNNTFIISSAGGSVVRIAETIETVEMHNNVVYSKGTPVNTRFLDEAGFWASGRQVKAINNWIQTGTDRLPAELTGTIFGTNPGFIDINASNFKLVTGSPLINVGANAPATIAAFPFPGPLYPPVYHAPMHAIQVSPAEERPSVGAIDIGAYEFGSGSSCVSTITPILASYAASAGSGSVSVAIGPACNWTAISNDSWITVTSGANSTGNGTVNYSVANNNSGARSGTLTIASKTVTINQAASGACTYSIAPVNAAIVSYGGTGNVTVTSGCSWTATSNSPWITITSGATGTGNGNVTYSVAANSAAGSLTGTLTIAGQTFTVNQSGLPANCTNVGSNWVNTSFATQTGSFTAQFDATPSTAATNDAVALSNGAVFTFPELACIALFDLDGKIKARNGGSYPASSISYLAGVSYHFRFVVNVVAHTYSVYVTPAGGSELTIGLNYAFRTEQNAVTQLNNFHSLVNNGGGGTGTLQVCNFTLGAPGCTYVLSSTSASITSVLSTGSTTITAGAGCAWTAVSNAAWLSITAGASGTGNGTTAYSVAANTGVARTGTMTIAGQTFTVSQAAPVVACTYSISPASASVTSALSTGSTTITTGAGCAWTAVSNAAWITITAGSSGTGNGTTAYSAAVNTGIARTGTMTIAGQTFTVSQAAPVAACTYSISPASANIPSALSTGNTSITAGAGCTWTAVSNVAWITITAGASGTGNGSTAYSVAANIGVARTGTMTIAGQTFTVSQAAAVVAGGTIDLYINETTPTISFIAGTGQVGTGTVVTVTTGGVGNSAYMKFSGLKSWDKSKRLHYTVAKDISAVAATAILRISVDISSNTTGTGIGIHFNDAWDQVVYSPNVNNTTGFQTFDIPISSVRSAMGNTLNDIYIEPSNGWTTGSVIKIDNVQLVAAPAARMGTPNAIPAINNIAAENVAVFPNPSDNIITVVLPKSANKSTTFKLVDANGRIVLSDLNRAGAVKLNIQTRTFANGVYNLIISTPTGNVVKKIVVNH